MSKFRPHNRHGARLTPDLIRQMYAMRDEGKTLEEVRQYFGTSLQHAGRILRGEQWAEVWAAYYGPEGKAVETVNSPAKDAILDDVLLPKLTDKFGDPK